MIGGLFIYNHKGEVLISRVYRDDIGYVSQEQSCCKIPKFWVGGGLHVSEKVLIEWGGWTGWD